MKVWRIGSNWGKVNLLPIFKSEKIAFAGLEVENGVKQVMPGDIVCITNGQQIVGIGEVTSLKDLSAINIDHANEFEYVTAITFKSLYWREENKKIDFGIYEGQGRQFHKAGNSYRDFILKIFKEIMDSNKNLEIKKLLEYKKQIILQGPPGTGKTKLAKEIADEILNDNPNNLSTMQLIEDFFKLGKTDENYNENFRNRLSEFYDNFPKDCFSKMDLDDYCIGKTNNTNFCWWIEKGLDKYGKFTPGNSDNYIIYYSKEDKDYRLKKHPNESISEVFPKIQSALEKLAINQDISEASNLFGESFIIKILNSYFPDKYFPINGRTSLVNLMKIFEKPFKKISTLELNLSIQNIFNEFKNKYPSEITSLDFMHFLFSKFNLKNDGNLFEDSKELNITRNPTIIQFHPSYTYEDFVRGIVAETNGRYINYNTQDKTLAEIAKEAYENPYSDYVLIIDEINRANLSSVLGELIYALEYRYYFNDSEKKQNESKVHSLYALTDKETDEKNKKLVLPENLYIIGTMNTADRSVGHIDYAIRRRFAFVDVLPEALQEDDNIYFNTDDFNKVAALFNNENVSSDFEIKDVQIGHSYFIVKKEEAETREKAEAIFQMKMKYEVIPILLEYVKDGILKESVRESINKFLDDVTHA